MIKTIIHFLQQNAEWMCAIAITLFTAMQCYLAYQQNMQDIKNKRLELANELDEVCSKFAIYDKDEAQRILQWLVSRASKFIFLLNKEDREKYRKLCAFLYNYHSFPVEGQTQMIEIMKQFHGLLGELDMVLGNADYGYQKDDKKFKSVVKNA